MYEWGVVVFSKVWLGIFFTTLKIRCLMFVFVFYGNCPLRPFVHLLAGSLTSSVFNPGSYSLVLVLTPFPKRTRWRPSPTPWPAVCSADCVHRCAEISCLHDVPSVDTWGIYCGQCHPWAGAPGLIRKQALQARGNKPVSSSSQWLLLQLLPWGASLPDGL